MKHPIQFYLSLIFVSIIFTACDNKDPVIDNSISLSTPNQYQQYVNPQVSLPAGNYTVIAATVNNGETDEFKLSVKYDDTRSETFSANWSNSGGMDATSSNNPRFPITLNKASGIQLQLTSTVDNYLYLVDKNENIIAENNNKSTSSTNATIDLPASKINNAAWANAYYTAIDPNNERDTLAKWKIKNGFDDSLVNNGADVLVIFRDARDLGYGRKIYARKNANGCVAFYVENFFVDIIDGLDYNSLNLVAAINNDHQHHFGTNAIEFSDLDGDCDGNEPMFNKFYTFTASIASHENQPRAIKVDLDGRGKLFMPGTCISCHGGTSKPLLADGTFASGALPGSPYPSEDPLKRAGDTHAKLQPMDIEDFEFSDRAGFSQAEQLAAFRELNEMIYSTYPSSGLQGLWHDDFSREIINGWYNGDVNNASNIAFNADFVPEEWRPNPDTGTPPAGSDQLFLSVIKPYCLACHSKMGIAGLGTNADTLIGDGKDIDFSSYTKFISHENQIKDYVYRRGNMPLSLLTYDKFWASDAPNILASFLTDFTPDTTNGKINPPGKPIANAGLDRISTSPVTLDANASLFSDGYDWAIISTPATSTSATLNSPNDVRPVFTADVDGGYTLQLISRNSQTGKQSIADTVTIRIDSTLNPAPKDITFNTHIRPILDTDNVGCVECHHHSPSVITTIVGIPVFFNIGSETLYQDTRERINFAEPGLSPLLLKPTGNHHFGGSVPGFDLNGDQSQYDLFVNWILEGAREE